jgi:YggT family protein
VSLSCTLTLNILVPVLRIFWILMLVYAVVSWVPSLRGRWTEYIAMVVEPVLMPFRRIIPPLGGLDVSFLVVILLVGWLMSALPRAACPYY